MYKHEKQAVERLQSNHIHMLSTLSTAIIASFLIILLSGTMLFPMMAFADEPQPVAQVGNTTYMSVQDAIGHTSMKNNTVTLLTDTTESITVTPPKVVRGITLELNGHALNASNTTTITVPANMQLTITGSGTVVGGEIIPQSTAVERCGFKVVTSRRTPRSCGSRKQAVPLPRPVFPQEHSPHQH